MGASAQVSKNPIRRDDWYEKAIKLSVQRHWPDVEAIEYDIKQLLIKIIVSHGYCKTAEAITGEKYERLEYKED